MRYNEYPYTPEVIGCYEEINKLLAGSLSVSTNKNCCLSDGKYDKAVEGVLKKATQLGGQEESRILNYIEITREHLASLIELWHAFGCSLKNVQNKDLIESFEQHFVNCSKKEM